MAGCLVVAGGVCIYYALQLPLPESMNVRLLPDSFPLELHVSWREHHLHEVLWRPATLACVICGLKAGDTGTTTNSDTVSQLLLDETFPPSSESAQLYLSNFCDSLFAGEFAIKREECAMNMFENWLAVQSGAPSTAYSEHCNGVVALLVPEDDFDPCIIAWSREAGNMSVLQEDGKVRVLMITVEMALKVSCSLGETEALWNKFEGFLNDQTPIAPEGVNKCFHTSFMWWYCDASVQMKKTALGSGVITLGFAALVVVLSSKSFILTLVSCRIISLSSSLRQPLL